MSAHNWRIPTTFADHMGDTEKRIQHQEGRPLIRQASDLLGPGFGPYAVETQDWNSEECAFNGYFFSAPGALNAPGAQAWIGQTVGTVAGEGVQYLWDYQSGDEPGAIWQRSFSSPIPGIRAYKQWAEVSGGGGGGGGLVIYTHSQGAIANNWTITHNLGHNPITIEVTTTGGDIAEGFDVINTVPGVSTVIGFDIAISGTARLI